MTGIRLLAVLMLTMMPALSVFGDTLVLKTGETVEGRVVEDNGRTVRIEVCGAPVTYFSEEIERIERTPVSIKAASEELSSVQECEIIRGAGISRPEETFVSFAPADQMSEAEWIRQHHGIIFYQDYPNDRYNLTELARLARELGTQNVKTWLKGDEPGDIPKKVQSIQYINVFEPFKVICLNVCPEYILQRWDQGRRYDAQTRKDIESDFYELTKSLIGAYQGQDKTFIINYFFEINVYLGTAPSGRPDFPVLDFIADAQRGVKRAMRESSMKGIRILDCVESNCSHDNFHFVKNIFPKVSVDLYSLSFYGFGSLKSSLDYWAKFAPDNGPFGKNNVMVGEYGIKMEDSRVRGNELAQAEYLDSIRKEAKEKDVPYIFLFWMADQNSKVSQEGSFGLVALDGHKRSAWQDLARSYK